MIFTLTEYGGNTKNLLVGVTIYNCRDFEKYKYPHNLVSWNNLLSPF